MKQYGTIISMSHDPHRVGGGRYAIISIGQSGIIVCPLEVRDTSGGRKQDPNEGRKDFNRAFLGESQVNIGDEVQIEITSTK